MFLITRPGQFEAMGNIEFYLSSESECEILVEIILVIVIVRFLVWVAVSYFIDLANILSFVKTIL